MTTPQSHQGSVARKVAWCRFYVRLWRMRPKGGKFPFWPGRVF